MIGEVPEWQSSEYRITSHGLQSRFHSTSIGTQIGFTPQVYGLPRPNTSMDTANS
jgi:hypothetical protein